MTDPFQVHINADPTMFDFPLNFVGKVTLPKKRIVILSGIRVEYTKEFWHYQDLQFTDYRKFLAYIYSHGYDKSEYAQRIMSELLGK